MALRVASQQTTAMTRAKKRKRKRKKNAKRRKGPDFPSLFFSGALFVFAMPIYH